MWVVCVLFVLDIASSKVDLPGWGYVLLIGVALVLYGNDD